MAISIDWPTRVINVPQADLVLVGGSVYELDVNVFRQALNTLQSSDEGMPELTTHDHNSEVTLAGTTFARSVEIINGYTVTFEDGQYAVNLKGANNNLADVTNVNQVSIRVFNSAGLIVSTGGGGDSWTAPEKEQMRDALGIDGDKTIATGGQLQEIVENNRGLGLFSVVAGGTAAEVRTGATRPDGYYDRMMVVIETAGSVHRLARRVTRYSATNGAFTLEAPLPFVPSTGDILKVLGIPRDDPGVVGAGSAP